MYPGGNTSGQIPSIPVTGSPAGSDRTMYPGGNVSGQIPSIPVSGSPIEAASNAAHRPTLPPQSQAPLHSPVFGATPEAVSNLHAKMGQGYHAGHLPPSYASGNIGATGMPHRWNQLSGQATDYQPISAPTNGAQPFANVPTSLSGVRTGGALASS